MARIWASTGVCQGQRFEFFTFDKKSKPHVLKPREIKGVMRVAYQPNSLK
jgi:hypothetical protein